MEVLTPSRLEQRFVKVSFLSLWEAQHARKCKQVQLCSKMSCYTVSRDHKGTRGKQSILWRRNNKYTGRPPSVQQPDTQVLGHQSGPGTVLCRPAGVTSDHPPQPRRR
eukprot:764399-Hanusia_phi.AAC.2